MKTESIKCDACGKREPFEDYLLPLNWTALRVGSRNGGEQEIDLCPAHGLMPLHEIVGVAATRKKKP